MAIGANLLITLIIIAAVTWLQIFLSKKESKWPGLVLPSISFIYSLLTVLLIAVDDKMSAWEVFGLIASTFFIANIPTIILLAVYWGCREKIRQNKALEKMNIQDLE
ncbi:hypothetical protein [Paenibacillus senegalensis]|uniref:hypothetical protein n=1 Tax=Paenibacillus senegalensis TaxID=1465766 RepID=UPI0002896151|nr:hypothetical protein [Paenibacillus senegalensis]